MSDKMFKVIIGVLGGIIAVCIGVVVVSAIRNGDGGSNASQQASQSQTPTAPPTPKPTLRNDIANQLSSTSSVWNENLSLGNKDAKNHMIEYTDMFCPYCAKFNRAIEGSLDSFKKDYINTNKLKLEVRLVSMLTEKANSDKGGAYAYCSASQKKFWEFYPAMLEKIDAEFFSKGIGSYHGAPEIPTQDDSFFTDVAKKVGLDMAKLTACINNKTGAQELSNASYSFASAKKNGVPYFVLNNFTTSGFDGDYSRVLQFLAAGNVS